MSSADNVDAALEEFLARNAEQLLVHQKVRVWITLGDLGYAAYPVALGHYEDDVIVGAEADLDARLSGRLSRRRRMGIYAGEPGTAEILLDASAHPTGAIVFGLGRIGELTPGTVTDSFSLALLRFAIEKREKMSCQAEQQQPLSIGISAVLVGTSDRTLSVSESIHALLEGVLRTNQALSRDSRMVQICNLELIELEQSRAVEAGHYLREICGEAGMASHFEQEPRLRHVPGARVGFSQAANRAWWNRLQIERGPEGDSLVFKLLTDRARAEVSLLPTQRNLVDQFIERCIRTAKWDAQLAATLYELLTPNRLKKTPGQSSDTVLVVDQYAARYPWELIHDLSFPDTRPWAIQAGLIRQLATSTFRAKVLSTPLRTALVVGDPPSEMVPLPAAREEAQMVAGLLGQQQFDVTTQVGSSSHAVISSLFAKSYRVLHLAGHGVYQFGEKKVSGMVLGQNCFLTPIEIGQMQQVPELVFINCCHLGRIEEQEDGSLGQYNELAATLAQQLVRMGVRAVVAAGWAVDDEAASAFAKEFYAQMLRGRPFGRAVHRARILTYVQHSQVNTWGAYQCYGDPDYVLVKQAAAAAGDPPAIFVDLCEAVAAVENVGRQAETGPPERIPELRSRLEGLEQSIAPWNTTAEVLAALGRTHGRLGQFKEAIECYEKGLRVERAHLPLRALEQLANLRIRWAFHVFKGRASGDEAPDPGCLIRKSIAEIDRLLEFGRTIERLCLRGSAHKHLALVSDGELRTSALGLMASAYQEAHEQALEKTGRVDFYPLLNWLLGTILLRFVSPGKPQGEVDTWIQDATSQALESDREAPSFWSLAAVADSQVVKHLARGDLFERREEIAASYSRAVRRGCSQAELLSVVDHLEIVAWILKESGADAAAGGGGAVQGLLHVRSVLENSNEGSLRRASEPATR